MNAGRHKSPIPEVGEGDFGSEILKSRLPVLVAFWAPWSRPCHVLDAALEEVAAACAGTVNVVKVNADDNPDLSLLYDVQSIPTLLCFVDGAPRARVVGTASREAILARLQAVLASGDSHSPSPDLSKNHENRSL